MWVSSKPPPRTIGHGQHGKMLRLNQEDDRNRIFESLLPSHHESSGHMPGNSHRHSWPGPLAAETAWSSYRAHGVFGARLCEQFCPSDWKPGVNGARSTLQDHPCVSMQSQDDLPYVELQRQVLSMMEYDSRARSLALYLQSSGGMPSPPTAFPMEARWNAVSSSTRFGSSWIGTVRVPNLNLQKLGQICVPFSSVLFLWESATTFHLLKKFNPSLLRSFRCGTNVASRVFDKGQACSLDLDPEKGLRQCKISPAGAVSERASISVYLRPGS